MYAIEKVVEMNWIDICINIDSLMVVKVSSFSTHIPCLVDAELMK